MGQDILDHVKEDDPLEFVSLAPVNRGNGDPVGVPPIIAGRFFLMCVIAGRCLMVGVIAGYCLMVGAIARWYCLMVGTIARRRRTVGIITGGGLRRAGADGLFQAGVRFGSQGPEIRVHERIRSRIPGGDPPYHADGFHI